MSRCKDKNYETLLKSRENIVVATDVCHVIVRYLYALGM
jgi:hypothetical protein